MSVLGVNLFCVCVDMLLGGRIWVGGFCAVVVGVEFGVLVWSCGFLFWESRGYFSCTCIGIWVGW